MIIILWLIAYLAYGGILAYVSGLSKPKPNYWLVPGWLPMIFCLVLIAIFKPVNY